MNGAEDDWLLTFLNEFASMSADAREAALDALSPEHRSALVAFADARDSAAVADLIAVLDAGHVGLDRLYDATDPTDLFTVINVAARERPNIVAEALFAAVVVHRGWTGAEPTAIAALREQWIWHVHERLEAAAASEADDPAPDR